MRRDDMVNPIDRTSNRDIAARVARRYRRPWHRDYVRAKLRHDPVYATLGDLLAGDERPLLDVGCGLGLLGLYLREARRGGAYRGIDFDEGKIAVGREAAAGEAGMSFEPGDARGLPAFAGHVALIDVLHYLPAAAQHDLLRAAAARVAPGALLFVRSVLRERGWRFRLTVAEEFFIHAIGWMRSPARHYPLRAEIEAPLRAAGLEVDTRPLWGSTPFNSFAILARRPGGIQDAPATRRP